MKTKDFFLNIIIALVSVFATYLITVKIYKENTKTRYIDVYSNIENNFIGKPSFLEKNLTVLLDNEPIENFCQRTISLFNYSDLDFEKLNVVIELYYPNGDSVCVFDTLSYGENKLLDKVILKENSSPSLLKGGFKINYNISTANRSKDLEPFFTANFLAFGEEPPEFKVHIDNKGIKVREFDFSLINKKKWYETEVFVGVVAILFYASFLFIMVKIGKRKREKRKKEILDFVENKLRENKINPLDREMEKNIAIDVEYYRELFFYEKSPKWERKIFRRKEPMRLE